MPPATPPDVHQPQGTVARRAGDDFVNLTAHELKNPLRAMAVDAEFLARRLHHPLDSIRQTSELVEVAERMAITAHRMSEQVSDLLALAINDHSKARTTLIDLAPLVNDVLDEFEEQLRSVGGQVTIGPLPSVTGAAAGLRMLFRNLISNAIRYRHPGRPMHLSITARGYRLDEGRRLLHFEVTDNGIGIPKSEQRRIFEPYSRAGVDNDGLGLGLAICDRVVGSMGGTIHVESDGENGSQFSILIHDQDPDDPAQRRLPLRNPDPPL